MSPLRIVDFDEPVIRIETHLALHPVLHVERRRALQDGGEKAIRVGAFDEGLRRGTIEARRAVQMIDLEEHRAGLRRAAPAQHRVDPLDGAAAQIGRDPKVGAKPRHYSTASPDRAASSRAVRGPNSPVTGMRRSRSKRSTAWRVSGPMMPSAFDVR